MREAEIIWELKAFLRRYRHFYSQPESKVDARMWVSSQEREAIADALDILKFLNPEDTEDTIYPRNIYAILGFNPMDRLTLSQLQGFDYVMSNLLSDTERGVIEARFRDGKSRDDVAKEFGISPNTIGDHIKRILNKLRIPECLEKLAAGPVSDLEEPESASYHNEYSVLRNRRLKAIDELTNEIERLETITETIKDKSQLIDAEMYRRIADNSIKEALKIKIDDLNLSMRAYNVLIRKGIYYVSDLENIDYDSLLKERNCGKDAADEIMKKAGEYGIVIKKNKS